MSCISESAFSIYVYLRRECSYITSQSVTHLYWSYLGITNALVVQEGGVRISMSLEFDFRKSWLGNVALPRQPKLHSTMEFSSLEYPVSISWLKLSIRFNLSNVSLRNWVAQSVRMVSGISVRSKWRMSAFTASIGPWHP